MLNKASGSRWFRSVAAALLACAVAAGCSDENGRGFILHAPREDRAVVPPASQWAETPDEPSCARGGPADRLAARRNAANLQALDWAPFGRPEYGWAIYRPLVGREIGSPCSGGSPGFAAALAGWQARHGVPAAGVLDQATFDVMKTRWQLQRPFVLISRAGICPNPPPASQLADARLDEGYGGKPIQLRVDALAAYRRMVQAAKAEQPRIAEDPRNLQIFSGFRDPAADAARCALEQNCDGLVRATCSAHRTGLAMDLYVGQAPGYGPDSTADPNRLYMSRTVTYAWLTANAQRFGFVNYPFEPWHWEYVGG